MRIEPPLVAPEGDVDLARRQRHGRSRRRATGVVGGVVRVERAAEVALRAEPEAAGQTVHHVLARDRPPGRQDAGHDRGVDLRDEALQRRRAVGQRHAGDRGVVLVAHRLAGEEARLSTRDLALPGPCVQRVLGRARAVATAALGERDLRRALVEARLRELVHLGELLGEVAVQEHGLVGLQRQAETAGGVDHLLDARDCVHGLLLRGDVCRRPWGADVSGAERVDEIRVTRDHLVRRRAVSRDDPRRRPGLAGRTRRPTGSSRSGEILAIRPIRTTVGSERLA